MIMKLTTIEADRWKMDGGVAFGVVPKSLWTKVYPADEFNLIDITTRCLLIQHDAGNILIDTGMGNKRGEKYYKYKYRSGEDGLLPGIAAAGLSPADITDIVFTHLHDDHVGGATQLREDGSVEEVFPNTRYWCSEAQWKWAWNSNKREQAAFFPDNLQALEQSGRLNLVTSAGPWIPHIRFEIFNGHTRGQIVPFIEYYNRTLVFCADFIPSKGHIPLADARHRLHQDVDADAAARARLHPDERQRRLDAERGVVLVVEEHRPQLVRPVRRALPAVDVVLVDPATAGAEPCQGGGETQRDGADGARASGKPPPARDLRPLG